MQVLSSSQKKDITPSQLLPQSMFDFIYAKDGEAVIKSGDTDFILSGGQMLIVSSADGKTMSVTKAPFKYYSFSLASEEIKKILGNSSISSFFAKKFKSSYHIFDFSESNIAEELCSQLEKEYQSPYVVAGNTAEVLLKLLMLEIYKLNPSPFGNTERQNKSMQKIREYIDAHYGEEITVEKLAESAYLSPPYLSHSFKSFSGFSPKQYLTAVRLVNANKLLTTTNLSINEICRKAGFSDINNFIRTFKSFYGTTPKKFRSI